ncbi:hypothetical protein [Klebsiella quasipneumoniae]|uniref:hypothetical protein n=1 Tax=Klebsiella quasipneumoniae TaxID=1463165 RepID=UPI00388FC92B
MRENRQVNLGDVPVMQINSGKRYEGKPLGSPGANTSSSLRALPVNSNGLQLPVTKKHYHTGKVKRDRLIENAKGQAG